MPTISARLPSEEKAELDDVAELLSEDRSTTIRKALREGLETLRLRVAVEQYQSGDVSAAEPHSSRTSPSPSGSTWPASEPDDTARTLDPELDATRPRSYDPHRRRADGADSLGQVGELSLLDAFDGDIVIPEPVIDEVQVEPTATNLTEYRENGIDTGVDEDHIDQAKSLLGDADLGAAVTDSLARSPTATATTARRGVVSEDGPVVRQSGQGRRGGAAVRRRGPGRLRGHASAATGHADRRRIDQHGMHRQGSCASGRLARSHDILRAVNGAVPPEESRRCRCPGNRNRRPVVAARGGPVLAAWEAFPRGRPTRTARAVPSA